MQDNPIKKLCIYCVRDNSEARFTREHIIPQSIKGRLFIDDLVCSDCNSFIGRSVDLEILKMPEVLDAMKQFSIPYRRAYLLNQFYSIVGITNSQRLKARASDFGFKILNQEMPDGSVIFSDCDFRETFRRSVLRDKDLNNSKITKELIEAELEELADWHEKASPGEKIESPALQRTLVRHSGRAKFQMRRKVKINIESFIAKIAYEFIFLIGLKKVAQNLEIMEALYKQITTGLAQNEIFIFRAEPPRRQFDSYHAICLESGPAMMRVEVGLFGRIDYVLIAPPLSSDFFEMIEGLTGLSPVVGILYEQELVDTKKKFGVITPDGQVQPLYVK